MAVRARRSGGIAISSSSTHSTPRSKLTSPTKTAVLSAMEGHVLAEAQMIGTYQKAG